MRLAGSYSEVVELACCVLGLFGFRLHISCNRVCCWRRELSPTGLCRKHQGQRGVVSAPCQRER